MLVDTGDATATPGTAPWAAAVRLEMWRCLDSADVNHTGLNGFIETFAEFEGWKALKSSINWPYQSFEDFCLDRRPHGLGLTRTTVEKWLAKFGWAKTGKAIASDPAEPPQPKAGEIGNGRSRDNITATNRGTNPTYLVRRLKRDAPKVAEQLARGEFPSARAAGIAAGIVKVPTVLEIAKRAYAKLSPAEVTTFWEWVDQQLT